MPFQKEVRPLEDYEVDRSGVQVQQCIQLTDTNRSRAYPQVREERERDGMLNGSSASLCGVLKVYVIYRISVHFIRVLFLWGISVAWIFLY